MELQKYKVNKRRLLFIAFAFLFLILAVNSFCIMFVESGFEQKVLTSEQKAAGEARARLEYVMRDALNNLRIERQAYYSAAGKMTDNIYADIQDRVQKREAPRNILRRLSEFSAFHIFYYFLDGEVTLYSGGTEESYSGTKDDFLTSLEDFSLLKLFSITEEELIAVAVPQENMAYVYNKGDFQTEDGREVFLYPLGEESFRFEMNKDTMQFRKWEELSGGLEIDLEKLPSGEGIFFEASNARQNLHYAIYLYASAENDFIAGVYGDLSYTAEISQNVYRLHENIIYRQWFAILISSVSVAAAMFFLVHHIDKTYLTKTFYSAKKLEEEKDVAKSEYKNLYNEVNHDVLTGIYNRGFTEVYLSDLFHNRGEFFSCIIGDIDDFKKVNDTYGHEAGDKVLKGISAIVTENLRPKDVFARWGGEEFLIVIKFLNLDEVSRIAERIRGDIEKKNFRHSGVSMRITISFGISCFKETDRDYTDIIIRADKALYRSKALGKNMITIDA